MMKAYKYPEDWYTFNVEDRDKYGTPQELFNTLNRRYIFTLDPCANEWNHKTKKYFSEEDNGLIQDWAGETVFINPPYSRGNIEKWIKKAYMECLTNNILCVMLLPNRTGMPWFRDYARLGEVQFIIGRLAYETKGGMPLRGSNFDSMVVIFDPEFGSESWEKYRVIDREGNFL